MPDETATPQQNEPPPTHYATFTSRMMASVIDIVLTAIFLVPLFSIIQNAMDLGFFHTVIENTVKTNGALTVDGLMRELQFWPQEQIRLEILKVLKFNTIELAVTTPIILLFWVYRSATPGKMILRMKIVDAKTGGAPSKAQLIGRYFGYFLSTLPLGLGFLWIYYDKKKQGWHDKLAGTVVIVEPRNDNIL